MKVNQVVSQQPIFSFKASISRWTQQYNTGGFGRFMDATHNWKLKCKCLKSM